MDLGETIELTMVLENIGDSTAYNVEATLRTTHPLVSVIDSQGTFGDIPPGDTMANLTDFVFSVSPEIVDGETIPFQLDINATNGSWTYEDPNILAHAPFLVYYSLDIDDVVGNGNGKADPGETCNLAVTLKNEGGDESRQVEATLVSHDIYVTVTSGTSSYPDIPPEGTNACLTPYQIIISEDCPVGHSASLTLEMEAWGPYFTTDTLDLVIGQKPILFVDDDGGGSFEGYFLTALDSVGLAYDIWTYETQGSPTDSVLTMYQAVVWSTGPDYGTIGDPKTLTLTDQARLMSYLEDGGNLFLSSQDLLYDNDLNTFITDYLHVAARNIDEGIHSVAGIVDDTISDGMSFSLSYPFFNLSDCIVPGSGAVGIFSQTGKSSFSELGEGLPIDRLPGAGITGLLDSCALRYPASGESTYKVVFFSFPFEAVPQEGAYPHNAHTLMRRIMNWFGVEKPPYMPGDANGDQKIDLGDVVYLVNYLFKDGSPPDPLEAGDANCDGTVDLGDVVYLVNYLYREGPPPC